MSAYRDNSNENLDVVCCVCKKKQTATQAKILYLSDSMGNQTSNWFDDSQTIKYKPSFFDTIISNYPSKSDEILRWFNNPASISLRFTPNKTWIEEIEIKRGPHWYHIFVEITKKDAFRWFAMVGQSPPNFLVQEMLEEQK